MRLEEFSINCLSKVITGDNLENNGIYRSGPMLVDLFNRYGARDIYGQGFPTRWVYTQGKLNDINGSKELEKVILDIIDNRHFIECEYNNTETINMINTIIKHDRYKIVLTSDDKYIIEGDLIEENEIEVEVTFKDIQEKLISELEKSKYVIMAAVAWFTDQEVYEVLKRKQEEGIIVRLIISDDTTNVKSGLDYTLFDTYKMPKFGRFNYNIMHNKFCIIDLKTVLEGSYNWTRAAEYHKEHFVTMVGPEQVELFASRFMELRSQIVNKTYDFEF